MSLFILTYDIIKIGDISMDNKFDKEKISDFVDVFLETINIDRNHPYFSDVSLTIKNAISRRILLYKEFNYIPADIDNFKNYLIKPYEDGKYSLEDFFLNRLFISLSDYCYSYPNGIGEGSYVDGEISVDFDHSYREAMDRTHDQQYANSFAIEALIHEVGHALQVSFSGSLKQVHGHKYRTENYLKLLENLKEYKNGKYNSLLVSKDDLELDGQVIYEDASGMQSKIKGGKYSGFDTRNIDEMMNELEATKLASLNKEIYKYDYIYDNGNITDYYTMVPSIACAYSRWYGISKEFFALLGKANVFQAQYGNPEPIFERFDNDYQDISGEMFGDSVTPMQTLKFYVDKINEHNRSYKYYLFAHEFLARCIAKKVDKVLEEKPNIPLEYVKDYEDKIDSIIHSTLHHMDPAVDASLKHIQIYNDIKEKLNSKLDEESFGTR